MLPRYALIGFSHRVFLVSPLRTQHSGRKITLWIYRLQGQRWSINFIYILYSAVIYFTAVLLNPPNPVYTQLPNPYPLYPVIYTLCCQFKPRLPLSRAYCLLLNSTKLLAYFSRLIISFPPVELAASCHSQYRIDLHWRFSGAISSHSIG